MKASSQMLMHKMSMKKIVRCNINDATSMKASSQRLMHKMSMKEIVRCHINENIRLCLDTQKVNFKGATWIKTFSMALM